MTEVEPCQVPPHPNHLPLAQLCEDSDGRWRPVVFAGAKGAAGSRAEPAAPAGTGRSKQIGPSRLRPQPQEQDAAAVAVEGAAAEPLPRTVPVQSRAAAAGRQLEQEGLQGVEQQQQAAAGQKGDPDLAELVWEATGQETAAACSLTEELATAFFCVPPLEPRLVSSAWVDAGQNQVLWNATACTLPATT